jgi:hypothetical protein
MVSVVSWNSRHRHEIEGAHVEQRALASRDRRSRIDSRVSPKKSRRTGWSAGRAARQIQDAAAHGVLAGTRAPWTSGRKPLCLEPGDDRVHRHRMPIGATDSACDRDHRARGGTPLQEGVDRGAAQCSGFSLPFERDRQPRQSAVTRCAARRGRCGETRS